MLDSTDMTTYEAGQPPSPTRKPRASITVTMLDDTDFVALKQRGVAGDRALAIFFTLVLLAKKLKNQGRFTQSLQVIGAMTYTTPKDLTAACDLITEVCRENRSRPWITLGKQSLQIRSFSKWNDEKRGGAREGAGRPSKLKSKPESNTKPNPKTSGIKRESNGNQIDFKVKSKQCASVSVSDSELNQQQQGALEVQGPEPAAAAGSASGGAEEPSPLRLGLAEAGITKPSPLRLALAEAGIAEPVLSELAACPHLTPAIIRRERDQAQAAGKRNGALVLNLRSRAEQEQAAAQKREQQQREQEREEQQQAERERGALEASYEAMTPNELAALEDEILSGMSERERRFASPGSKTLQAMVMQRIKHGVSHVG